MNGCGRPQRRVVLRPRADLDIDDQFEYLAVEGGLATAERFLNALRATLAALQENPKLGSSRNLPDERLAGLRIWPIQGFRRQLVFYIPTSDAIEVVRILHGARDVESVLAE